MEDIDCYIDCQYGNKVFHYGGNILQAYIPSIGRGRTIIKAIYSYFIKQIEKSEYFNITQRKNKQGELITINSFDYDALYKDTNLNKIISEIVETDEEVLFKFKYSNSDKIIPLLKPKTGGCNISPFSSKNLPKNKDYIIPDEELNIYKNIVAKIPQERILSLSHSTNNFIKTLVTKKTSLDDIKADMKLKCIKGKEYIHSIGKWNEYIKYLETELEA